MAKTAYIERYEAILLALGKNSSENTGTKNIKIEKSYHSKTVPINIENIEVNLKGLFSKVELFILYFTSRKRLALRFKLNTPQMSHPMFFSQLTQ